MKTFSIFALAVLLMQGSGKAEFVIKPKRIFLAFGRVLDEYKIDVFSDSELIFSGEIGPNDTRLSNPYIFADKRFTKENELSLAYIFHKKGTNKGGKSINRLTIPINGIQNRSIIMFSVRDISINNQQRLTEEIVYSSPSIIIRKDKPRRIRKYVIHSVINQKE